MDAITANECPLCRCQYQTEAQVRSLALEEAAQICRKALSRATNQRPDYQYNSIAPGCLACIDAIREAKKRDAATRAVPTHAEPTKGTSHGRESTSTQYGTAGAACASHNDPVVPAGNGPGEGPGSRKDDGDLGHSASDLAGDAATRRVPYEPTLTMIEAGRNAKLDGWGIATIWRAMYDAAAPDSAPPGSGYEPGDVDEQRDAEGGR